MHAHVADRRRPQKSQENPKAQLEFSMGFCCLKAFRQNWWNFTTFYIILLSFYYHSKYVCIIILLTRVVICHHPPYKAHQSKARPPEAVGQGRGCAKSRSQRTKTQVDISEAPRFGQRLWWYQNSKLRVALTLGFLLRYIDEWLQVGSKKAMKNGYCKHWTNYVKLPWFLICMALLSFRYFG